MKMKNVILLNGIFLMSLLLVTACKDEFTEEDLINKQREIAYSVQVVDASNNSFTNGRTTGAGAIAGAVVTVTQEGVSDSSTTDASGFAFFPKLYAGTASVSVIVTDFTDANMIVNIPSNGNVGQISTMVPVFATTGASTATIQGKVTIETDLTNLTREFATNVNISAGIDVTDWNFQYAYLNSNYNTGGILSISYSDLTSTATVDASGNYSITIPATSAGLPVYMRYPDVVADQVIAINNEVGQPRFPLTSPSVNTVSTNFVVGGGNIGLPFVFGSYAQLVDTPTGQGAIVAEINGGDLNINNNGEITGFNISNRGWGYPANSTINVAFFSLTGGSGATGTVDTDGNGRLINGSDIITNPGSGYSNGRTNLAAQRGFSTDGTPGMATSGSTYVRNIDYGTGTSRAIDVQ